MYLSKYLSVWSGKSYYKNIEFENQEDALKWTAQMEVLKGLRSQLVDDGGIEGLPREEFNRRSRDWLKACGSWIKTWGIDKVPQDLRVRIHETEDVLGVERTNFGADIGGGYE